MKKAIILLFGIAMLPALAYPQTTKLIFGPRDGDNAGILYADNNATIDVDVWFRTAPGICIIAIHLPLSTNDTYIRSDSRSGGELFHPFPLWDDVLFLESNDDPIHDGYTNQSLLGVKDLIGYDTDNGIQTEGEWWRVATFSMTSTDGNPENTPLCDAFIEGYQPEMNGIILTDYWTGEMDPSDYEVEYACLQFPEYPCGEYVIGDFNGSGAFNVADVVDGYSRLKTGSPDPAMTCECPPESGEEWAVAMDVNNSCAFNVADIVLAVHKLQGAPIEFIPCEYCPPEGWEP